ncbi:MAG TPA: hypothetical protein VI815_00105 [Candidatus Nanoarchaeia archaeon]|nr:hypothetical protein [Candidatus Nanoarchaeia archaeon]
MRNPISIRNEWISTSKYLWSTDAGRDVGVPATVERLSREEREKYREKGDHYASFDFKLKDREDIISDYFFNNQTLKDWDGNCALEGEIKRFGAIRYKQDPSKIVVTKGFILEYIHKNNLSLNFVDRAVKFLGIDVELSDGL